MAISRAGELESYFKKEEIEDKFKLSSQMILLEDKGTQNHGKALCPGTATINQPTR